MKRTENCRGTVSLKAVGAAALTITAAVAVVAATSILSRNKEPQISDSTETTSTSSVKTDTEKVTTTTSRTSLETTTTVSSSNVKTTAVSTSKATTKTTTTAAKTENQPTYTDPPEVYYTETYTYTEPPAETQPTYSETEATTSEQVTEPEPEEQITYINGILVVNKTYPLPADYAPGVDPQAQSAFNEMANAAASDGLSLYVVSGYRSYSYQKQLYDSYVYYRGVEETDRFSARPGHSEHQTGLAFDVNYAGSAFENTPEAIWLEEHCHEYGFIIRYPKDKESVTGFKYEPWHIRYLGKDNAAAVHDSGLCLEEYLGITSSYQ